jgi:hypothetical protein
MSQSAKASSENEKRMVRVKCIVHTKPWTDERALVHWEDAVIDAEVAQAMEAKFQIVIIGDA